MAEPLGVLLLPERLERFSLQAPVRDLLSIPRVVAVEPPRLQVRRVFAEAASVRQARRLRFPGEPRVLVLFGPGPYPLARSLLALHPTAELWYASAACVPQTSPPQAELTALDELARERAAATLTLTSDGEPRAELGLLRARLVELGIISHRPFVPGMRVGLPGRR